MSHADDGGCRRRGVMALLGLRPHASAPRPVDRTLAGASDQKPPALVEVGLVLTPGKALRVATGERAGLQRTTALKAGTLALLIVGSVALAVAVGAPDLQSIRTRVVHAGAWGPVVFVLAYGVIASIPWPRALLTTTGGALFGLWVGAALSLAGALLSASASFGIGRVLGRGAGERAASGRLAQAIEMIQDHGVATVVALRLAPMIPFMLINYAGGISSLQFRHFIMGSAIGMVPSSIAFAALGAHGTSPSGLVATGAALVLLMAAGAWRLRRQ